MGLMSIREKSRVICMSEVHCLLRWRMVREGFLEEVGLEQDIFRWEEGGESMLWAQVWR